MSYIAIENSIEIYYLIILHKSFPSYVPLVPIILNLLQKKIIVLDTRLISKTYNDNIPIIRILMGLTKKRMSKTCTTKKKKDNNWVLNYKV